MTAHLPTARHIVLIGLPGSGKTTVGRALAARLGRTFLDYDEEIEGREGRPVSRIFADAGEPYFRTLERELTEELRDASVGMVIAPGGGWVTVPHVVALVRPPAAVVYLTAQPETMLSRMGANRTLRPLLTSGDPLAALTRLLADRRAYYEECADLVVDTEQLDIQGVTDQIVAWLSLFERNSVMPGGR